ncbi:uncharacterized protein LOC129634267 isoform X3 [Bubalus kerabau]|uniref:uncharacterized protein LOC129634267 isoform X3 n=1 Tax=Bubalus carabanensis TaxID=3119969 RepID=UPI00244ED728|nr:uncharacterized protein LOC129634267 isoform X3 [Bubalus carabanensis]
MDLRDIFEQHCDWIQPGTTVLRKGDPQENISARKDLLTKFNGCSSDICINEGEKKKDPSLMEKEYPWVVKGLKAHTRQVGRLWLEPREPECTGTLTTADCLWLSCSSLWPQGDRHSFTLITYPPPVWLWSMSTQAGAPTHILFKFFKIKRLKEGPTYDISITHQTEDEDRCGL